MRCCICKNVNEIEEVASLFDVVSFDIFDTLVLRNVGNPHDVFDIVEAMAGASGIDAAPGFARARVDAESMAASHKGPGKDVTLEDIYQELSFSDGAKEALKKLELDTERKVIAPNDEMIGLARRLKGRGKTIVATSDMYLPASFLTTILLSFGCPVDRLYVSGDIGLRKSHGALFSYVVKDLEIGRGRIVHIGDNRRSDYLMPVLKGIFSILYAPNGYREMPQGVSVADFIVCGLLKNHYLKKGASLNSIGYSCLGPLLVGMCQWVHGEVEESRNASLRFLSRDGYILSKAYSLMYPGEPYKYSYVSRRSLTVPLLTDAHSFADVLEAIPYIKRSESMSSLFTKLGIEDSSLQGEMEEKYGKKLTRKGLSDGSYDSLFEDIKSVIRSNAAEEQKCLEGYLAEDYRGDVFAVDLGWYGSIQRCLEKVVDGNIHGLYLGLLKHDPDYSLKNARGYIYDYRKGDVFDSSMVFSFNGLIETFFSAPHGSVKRYRRTADGSFEPEFAPLEANNQEALLEIHDGGLDFVKDYLSASKGIPCGNVTPKVAFASMERLLTMPTASENDLLGDMSFYDASVDPLVSLNVSTKYLTHPKELVSDFLRSNWKIGFLNRILPTRRLAKAAYKVMVRSKGVK